MDKHQWLAEQFEANRTHLQARVPVAGRDEALLSLREKLNQASRIVNTLPDDQPSREPPVGEFTQRAFAAPNVHEAHLQSEFTSRSSPTIPIFVDSSINLALPALHVPWLIPAMVTFRPNRIRRTRDWCWHRYLCWSWLINRLRIQRMPLRCQALSAFHFKLPA